jgi:type III pantothenate kinase
MLLAIDVGNSETKIGVWYSAAWLAVWRRPTNLLIEADELADWLRANLSDAGFVQKPDCAIIASVVPAVSDSVLEAVARVGGCVPIRFGPDPRLGIEIRYEPPSSLGADRLANALAARARFGAPVLVVDIGTATTFEAVDRSGAFVGGAIMPGPALSVAAMVRGTATLPEAPLVAPPGVIGHTTIQALQSGIMLGHADAIQGLATRMRLELGGDTAVISTGGMGESFLPLCPILQGHYPTLTLDGLVLGFGLLTA